MVNRRCKRYVSRGENNRLTPSTYFQIRFPRKLRGLLLPQPALVLTFRKARDVTQRNGNPLFSHAHADTRTHPTVSPRPPVPFSVLNSFGSASGSSPLHPIPTSRVPVTANTPNHRENQALRAVHLARARRAEAPTGSGSSFGHTVVSHSVKGLWTTVMGEAVGSFALACKHGRSITQRAPGHRHAKSPPPLLHN